MQTLEVLQEFSSQCPLRTIRSFVRREGRMTKSQRLAWENLWSRYGLTMEAIGTLDLDKIFGRTAARVLEIGFGDGQSLLKMALKTPEADFIGVEVYRTGVGSLLAGIEKHKLSNIRLFCADVVEVLKHKIPLHALDKVQIFFPDPWPKSRHHKRRLIQPDFVALVAQKLRAGGILHLATDWADYANHMMFVMSSAPYFQNQMQEEQFSPRPSSRPLTKYEQRGLRLGHNTYDLIFKVLSL